MAVTFQSVPETAEKNLKFAALQKVLCQGQQVDVTEVPSAHLACPGQA